ncbi:hypothetical protein [Thermosipho melanesiensis]|uniref:hypothetical protein n=1 Tax=Thermosipho melanesiensis TaxID=46541 RepID=UPI00117D08DF|nr:hypothetical protein [Thermosipho melanesiensis]
MSKGGTKIMKNSKDYSIGLLDKKAVITTENIDTAIKLLLKLQLPTYIKEDEENVVDIRSIKNVLVTIQLEGDIQRIKLKSPVK